MKLCSIASGSSGNCIYVGDENTNLLVDAGISTKRIVSGLACIEVEPEQIDGILVTHEHSDHIMGIQVFVHKYHTPVYGTRETIQEILKKDKQSRLDPNLFHVIHADRPFHIGEGELQVVPFSIPHDARNPVCYTMNSGEHKVGVATDLGEYNDYIIEHLSGSEILLLEANHDIRMLEAGPYPYVLKRRILSEHGHLSNENSARLIRTLLNERLRYVFLGHLSKENNYPDLAYETIHTELMGEGYYQQIQLYVANRDVPSELVMV